MVGDILLVVNHAHAWPGVGIGIGRNNDGCGVDERQLGLG